MALLLALVLASTAAASVEPAAPTPTRAIILAERIVQHDPTWKPTSVYCERPTAGPYDTTGVPNGSRRTYTCQWVAQGDLLLPDEIVTVTAVYGSHGDYRFSLVSTSYRPSARRASCRIEPAATSGFRATCQKAG